jgi:phosphatidylinositol-3-phosphatase
LPMDKRIPLLLAALTTALLVALAASATAHPSHRSRRHDGDHHHSGSHPEGIDHVFVVDLENEDFATSFGPSSPARYLNEVIVPSGVLLENYFATGHASTDNYIAQVSGQAPNEVSGSDCISDLKTFVGTFSDVTPGTLDPDQATYPGQVDGAGCVYPTAVKTIADQLDQKYPPNPHTGVAQWREYAEDMGNTPSRDGGEPDPLGGSDCGHPPIGGADLTNTGTTTDQYADRHNPFVFFHSIIDDKKVCDANVVPLGGVKVGAGKGGSDVFSGHLAHDLAREDTTPRFGFITPNVCNDGHDAVCAGPNTEGTHEGGLVGADAWLRHWMPLLFHSPAYRSGKMLVVVTFDEANPFDPDGSTACCGERPGPSWQWPGYAAILSAFGVPKPTEPGQYPGGGRVGAVLLNPRWIAPGSVDTVPYNHYSALRSYEDLLGLDHGGADGHGHLGFAAQKGQRSFGADVFNRFAH